MCNRSTIQMTTCFVAKDCTRGTHTDLPNVFDNELASAQVLLRAQTIPLLPIPLHRNVRVLALLELQAIEEGGANTLVQRCIEDCSMLNAEDAPCPQKQLLGWRPSPAPPLAELSTGAAAWIEACTC